MLTHTNEAEAKAFAARWTARWGAPSYLYWHPEEDAWATSGLPALGQPGWRFMGRIVAPLNEQGLPEPAFYAVKAS